jgi:xanthine/uracil permease
MSPSALEKLIWVLIYGGLLILCLGFFVQRAHEPIGWTLIVVGAVLALVGTCLIWVRARMPAKQR